MRNPEDWFTLLLIIGAVVSILLTATGCTAVGYVASAVGAGHTEYKYQELEERVTAMENGDIW